MNIEEFNDCSDLTYKKYIQVLERVHNYCWDGWKYGYQPSAKAECSVVEKLEKAKLLQRVESSGGDRFGSFDIVGFAITSKGVAFFYEHYSLISESERVA